MVGKKEPGSLSWEPALVLGDQLFIIFPAAIFQYTYGISRARCFIQCA